MKIIKKYDKFIALGLGIIALIMIFLPAINVGFKVLNAKENITVSGLTSIFGGKIQYNVPIIGKVTIIDASFNIGALIAHLMPLLAGVLVVVYNKKSGWYASSVLFLAAAVLLFLVCVFFKNVNGLNNETISSGTTTFTSLAYSLAAGPIIGGIVATIGSIFTFIVAYKKKK